MKFKYYLFTGLVISSGAYLYRRSHAYYYPIQEITSFLQAESLLKRCGNNCLVLFDVDDVLISSPDYIARGASQMPWWLKLRILWEFPQFLNPKTAERIYSLIWQQPQRVLIEPKVVDIINDLKQRGACLLGLTSMESGNYGVIPSMPVWRADMLKN